MNKKDILSASLHTALNEDSVKVKQEITAPIKKDISKSLLGSFKKLNKNHTIFEINYITKTIIPASYDKTLLLDLSKENSVSKSKNKSITTKENCMYIAALNETSAKKKLKRDHGIVIK